MSEREGSFDPSFEKKSKEIVEPSWNLNQQDLIELLNLPDTLPINNGSSRERKKYREEELNKIEKQISQLFKTIAQENPSWTNLSCKRFFDAAQMFRVHKFIEPHVVKDDKEKPKGVIYHFSKDSKDYVETVYFGEHEDKKVLKMSSRKFFSYLNRYPKITTEHSFFQKLPKIFGLQDAQIEISSHRPSGMRMQGSASPCEYVTIKVLGEAKTQQDVIKMFQILKSAEACFESLHKEVEDRTKQVTFFDRFLREEPKKYEDGYLYEFVEKQVFESVKKFCKNHPEIAHSILDVNARITQNTLTPIIKISVEKMSWGRMGTEEEILELDQIALSHQIDELKINTFVLKGISGKDRFVDIPEGQEIYLEIPFYQDKDEMEFGHNLKRSLVDQIIDWVDAHVKKTKKVDQKTKMEFSVETALEYLGLSQEQLFVLEPQDAKKFVKRVLNEKTLQVHPDRNEDSDGEEIRKLNVVREILFKQKGLEKLFG